MVEVVNSPKLSSVVAGTYLALVIFIASVVAFFTYAGFFTPLGVGGLIAAVVSVFVEAIMLLILLSIYRTKYVLTDEKLIIKTTKLIGGSKEFHLRDILSVERTLMPFGIRLFGASFHGGYYHIPSLGRTFIAVTNFNDGVLVKTKHGNYIITPAKPEDFIKAIHESKNAHFRAN